MNKTSHQIAIQILTKLAEDPNLIGSYDTEAEVNAARGAYLKGQASPAPALAPPTPPAQLAAGHDTGSQSQQGAPLWPTPPQAAPPQTLQSQTQVAAAPLPPIKTSACHAASKRLKAKAFAIGNAKAESPKKAKQIAEAVIRDKLR